MIKKLHFQVEYFLSYLKRNLLFLVLGTVSGSLFFIFQDQLLSLPQKYIHQTQAIGIKGQYTKNTLPKEITTLISLGLTTISENDKPIISSLVKSYDVENDNKDYIFYLKDNLTWHNGKKLTAEDINYQIPGLKIEPIDQYSLKISSQKAFAPILSLLTQPLFKKELIGLGEYEVTTVQYESGHIKNLHLKSKNQAQNNLIYRFYPNQNDLITAFKLGEVDQIQISQLPKELSSQKNIKITQDIQANNRYSAIFLNTKKFSDKKFRQSLAYATPKTNDKNERCLGPISTNSWAYNNSVKQYNYNPQHAQELQKDSEEKITSINLTVNDRNLLATAEQIKKAWVKDLNIDTSITIENQIDEENFDAILAFGTIPHDPDQYYFWHSTQKTNLTNLQDERIDKLLEEGRQSFDPQERKKIYNDFQRYLLEESPAIFLSYPTTYTISRLK